MRFYVISYLTILACTTIKKQLPQTKASNLNKDRRAPATRLRNLLELQNITVLPSFKVWPRKDPSWLLWPLASVPRNSRRINLSKLASFHPISQRYPRALFEELLRRKILICKERPLKAPLTSGISSKWPFTPTCHPSGRDEEKWESTCIDGKIVKLVL